jgi:transposase
MKIRVQLSAVQQFEIGVMMRKTRSRIEAQRCRILLLLAQGESADAVHRQVGCVRSTVYMTLYRFEDAGIDGLRDQRLCMAPRKATREVRDCLLGYLDQTPKDHGWQRSNWTLELLSLQLERDTGVSLSPSHISHVLRQEKCRRGRPCPALRIPVRGRREILDRIERLVNRASVDEEVLYVDEADVDLNPRIGLTYIKRGQQPLVLTPGKNVKYYVAGALNARTGKVVYSHGPKKNSGLFVDLLCALHRAYRRARVIHVVLDNYIIHKSAQSLEALTRLKGRVRLHFLPPYSPEHNPIERLWKQLHDNVTRNHRHPDMLSLWKDVVHFLEMAQPFPGTKVSTLSRVA